MQNKRSYVGYVNDHIIDSSISVSSGGGGIHTGTFLNDTVLVYQFPQIYDRVSNGIYIYIYCMAYITFEARPMDSGHRFSCVAVLCETIPLRSGVPAFEPSPPPRGECW